MTFVLDKTEVKAINKLGLTKEQIFEPQRKDATDEVDAVSYINPKGFMPDNSKLSIAIFHKEKPQMRLRRSYKVINEETGLEEWKNQSIPTVESFKELIAQLQQSDLIDL